MERNIYMQNCIQSNNNYMQTLYAFISNTMVASSKCELLLRMEHNYFLVMLNS